MVNDSRQSSWLSLALLPLCLIGGTTAPAGELTWIGATNTFNAPGNWSGNTLPVEGDSLVFGAPGAGGVLLQNNLTGLSLGEITFTSAADAYVVGNGTTTPNVGNTLSLTGSIVNGSTNTQVINNPLTLSDGFVFRTGEGGGNITLGGDILSSNRVVATGSGMLTLSGNNAGSITVSQGTVVLNSNTAGGQSPIVLGDHSTGASNVAVNFGSGITGNNLALRGGALARQVTDITVSDTGSPGTATLGFTGATSMLYFDAALDRAVTITSNNATRLQRSWMGQITGSGAGSGNDSIIIDAGSGNWISIFAKDTGSASVANTFSGNIRVKSGNLEIGGLTYLGNTAANENLTIPATASVTVDAGAALQFVWGGQTFDALNGGGLIVNNTTDNQGTKTLTIGASGGSGDFGGTITSLFNITKTGAGTQIFSGNNTYSGVTTINEGTLQLGNGGTSGSVTGDIVNNATLSLNHSNNFNYGGVISGSGALVIDGDGASRLSAAQTYTGSTQINSGYLVLPTDVPFGLSASTVVTVAADGTLDLSNQAQKVAGLKGEGIVYSFGGNAGSLTLEVGAGQAHTFSGTLGGIHPNFSVTKSGPGAQIFSGTNGYTGATTIDGGTLISHGNGALGSTSAIMVNSTGILQVNYGGGADYAEAQINSLLSKTTFGATSTAFAFDTGNVGVDGNVSYGSDLALSTKGGLTKLGVGTLVLTGSNTYGGPTVVSAGALQVGNGGTTGALPPGTVITNNSTLAFDLSGSVTQSGAISGSGNLIQKGSGTLVLSGTNDYTGGTTISNGTLQIGDGGTAGSIAGDITNDGTLVFNRSDSISPPGSIGGTGRVIQQGSGVLMLSGTHAYTGATLINAGTLQVGNGGTTGSLSPSSAITVNGTLAFSRSDLVTQGIDFASFITGSGQIVQQGSGTLWLTGTNTLGGGAVVNSGTIKIGDGIHAATQNGGAGSAGANGAHTVGELGPENFGGVGSAGGNGIVVNNGGSLDLSIQTNIDGGLGGQGGRGGKATSGSIALPAAGGAGGPGGNAIVVNGGTLSSLPSQATVTGGAGGGGGEEGFGQAGGPGGETLLTAGGVGGAGGTAVFWVTASSWTSSGTITGGAGGVGGAGAGQTSGAGGSGIAFSQGGSLVNHGAITGGNGGAASLGFTAMGSPQRGMPGGDGGSGVIFDTGGSLINSGAISGGRGAAGEDVDTFPRVPTTGGTGGNGETAVIFSAGGSLTNSGTISGGLGGVGGSGDTTGANGSTGYGVMFSGSAGTLANQSGGIINGGVLMGDFANNVTLEIGSMINGPLNLGTSPSATLTLTGSGSQVYSGGVTGVTIFAGSLTKSGSGTWTLDQTLHYEGATTVNAGRLVIDGAIANSSLITINNGGTLGGQGVVGAVLVNTGGILSPGNSPGLLTIGGDLSLDSGATLVMEFGGTSLYDQLDVQGLFNAGGTLNLLLMDGFMPLAGNSFTIFSGSTPGFEAGNFNITSNLAGSLSWDTSQLSSNGIVTIVPEPTTISFLALGVGGVALARRRRQLTEI